jgi:hypothetical protein
MYALNIVISKGLLLWYTHAKLLVLIHRNETNTKYLTLKSCGTYYTDENQRKYEKFISERNKDSFSKYLI